MVQWEGSLQQLYRSQAKARQSSSGMPPSTCSQLHPGAQGGGGRGQLLLLFSHLIWLKLASLPQVCQPSPVLSSTYGPRDGVGEDSCLSSSATSSGYRSPVFLRYANLHLALVPPRSPGRRWGRTVAPPPPHLIWLLLASLPQVCHPPPVFSPTHEPRAKVGEYSSSSSCATSSGHNSLVFLRYANIHLFSAPPRSPGRRWGRTAVPPSPPPGLATACQSSSGMQPFTCSQLHLWAPGRGGGGQLPVLLSHLIWLPLASLPQVCQPPLGLSSTPSPGRRWGRTAVPPPPPPGLATARQSSSGMQPFTCSQLHPRAQGGGGGGQWPLLLSHLIWLQLASLPQVCHLPPVQTLLLC